MEFEQKKKTSFNETNYHFENLKNAREFSKELLLELRELVRSIVIFGSNVNDTVNKESDIDLMIVLDNISVYVTPELREAYKIIVDKIANNISPKFHIMTVNLSDLWDMARKGDPLLINILRFGYPLIDKNLIEPMQYLLEIGKIKPTREAAYNYISRSKTLLAESKNHIFNSVMDLYYSAIDILHAVLIVEKITPPSPNEIIDIYKEKFKNDKIMLKHCIVMEELFKLVKDIEHKKVFEVKGSQYDKLKKRTENLIKYMDKHLSDKIKKINNMDL